MPVTVGVNQRSVVHKASNGITIAFPDVCKTPAPAGPIPIPYPNIAKTATARKTAAKTQTSGGSIPVKNSNFSTSSGDAPGTTGGVVSHAGTGKAKFISPGGPVHYQGAMVAVTGSPTMSNQVNSEAQQLRGRLNALHQQILNLPGNDPERWQKLLEEYAVAASALYMTILPAD